jgi:hypothetical protein
MPQEDWVQDAGVVVPEWLADEHWVDPGVRPDDEIEIEGPDMSRWVGNPTINVDTLIDY